MQPPVSYWGSEPLEAYAEEAAQRRSGQGSAKGML